MDQQYNNNNVVDMSGSNVGAAPAPQKGGTGAIVGAVIIVLVVVLGALYFWGKEFNKRAGEESALNTEEEQAVLNSSDPITESLREQSTSDTAASIEADLQATDIDSLGDAGDVEAELGI